MVHKFLAMSDYRPPVRMMVLVGWARVTSAGEMRTGASCYDVLRIINVMMLIDGEMQMSQEVQICLDGELMNLSQAKNKHLPPCSVCEIVVCDWKPELDDIILGQTLEGLRRLAVDLTNNEDGIGDHTEEEEEESEERPFSAN